MTKNRSALFLCCCAINILMEWLWSRRRGVLPFRRPRGAFGSFFCQRFVSRSCGVIGSDGAVSWWTALVCMVVILRTATYLVAVF